MRRHSELTASTPTHASRVPIFAPTRRPEAKGMWEVYTAWGSATVTGRLGQRHRDVLDAAQAIAELEEWTRDGRQHLLIDPARLRGALGWNHINYKQIVGLIEELRVARVELKIPARGIHIVGGIVGDLVMANTAPPVRRVGALQPIKTLTSGGIHGRGCWRLSMSTAWSSLIKDDLSTAYPLDGVLKLGHGVSQALARYCYTQSRINSEQIQGVLARLGSRGRIRDRLVDLADDADGLAALGITLQEGRVCFDRRRNEWGASKTPVTASKTPVTANKTPVN